MTSLSWPNPHSLVQVAALGRASTPFTAWLGYARSTGVAIGPIGGVPCRGDHLRGRRGGRGAALVTFVVASITSRFGLSARSSRIAEERGDAGRRQCDRELRVAAVGTHTPAANTPRTSAVARPRWCLRVAADTVASETRQGVDDRRFSSRLSAA